MGEGARADSFRTESLNLWRSLSGRVAWGRAQGAAWGPSQDLASIHGDGADPAPGGVDDSDGQVALTERLWAETVVEVTFGDGGCVVATLPRPAALRVGEPVTRASRPERQNASPSEVRQRRASSLPRVTSASRTPRIFGLR